jgi:hypothetical protein
MRVRRWYGAHKIGRKVALAGDILTFSGDAVTDAVRIADAELTTYEPKTSRSVPVPMLKGMAR